MRNRFAVLMLGVPILCAAAFAGEDDGPGGFASALARSSSLDLDPATAEQFPIVQRTVIAVQPGGVRGFGMLAEYPPGGPKAVSVAWRSAPGAGEPYPPVTLLRVFDPNGNLVAVEELDASGEPTQQRTVALGDGPGGIWRVSFSGGRRGDEVVLGLPATKIWGVRGEMALGVTSTTPRPAWVWVPPVSREVLIGIESGNGSGIRVEGAHGKTFATVERDPTGRTGRLVLSASDAGDIFRLDIPDEFDGAMVIEGAPGLLCPTREAAERLTGGAVESHGLWVAGPLQARARAWMIENLPRVNRSPQFVFPSEIPEDLGSAEIHALAFGKYGPLNNLDGMIEAQNRNLNAESPFLGSFIRADERDDAENWSVFRPGRWDPFFDAASLAAAVEFESPLNPAHGDADLTRRATLAAFHHLSSMQGDDLLRERNLFETRFPIILAFFVYPGSLSQPLLSLREFLDPEAAEIWKQGAMAVGDKIADFQGYQSNQWAHMLLAHLDLYRATGERRFLGHFERMAKAYLENSYGPDSKFGQHPAGYFLEEYGPDGNYDRLNLFAVVSGYLGYRELPEAQPDLVETFRQGIERNLEFRSLFWLPEPDGSLHSPTGINSRTLGPLSGAGYPGDMMTRAEFPLGAARHAWTPEPDDTGPAWTMAHVANRDAWSRRVIERGLREGAGAFCVSEKEASGWWLPHLVHAFSQPRKVQAAKLPVEQPSGEWRLPGVSAWKQGGIYGVVFEDIPGGRMPPNARIGGAPMALWTQACGAFLSSEHPAKPASEPSDETELTFACVFYRDADGNLVTSGREPARRFEVEGGYGFSSALPEGGEVRWTYRPTDDGLLLDVRVLGVTTECFLNLPIRTGPREVEMKSEEHLEIRAPGGRVTIEWPRNTGVQLSSATANAMERLVLPLPGEDQSLEIRFVAQDVSGRPAMSPTP